MIYQSHTSKLIRKGGKMISKKLAGLLIIPALLGTFNASHAISNTATS